MNFCIMFFERSGSSLIQDMLSLHPEIYSAGECFDVGLENGREVKLCQDSLLAYESIFNAPAPICGFKYKYDIQVRHYPEIWDAMPLDTRIIHVKRRNLLKGAISKQNLLRLVELGYGPNIEEPVNLEPLCVDVHHALDDMEKRKYWDAIYDKRLNKFEYRLTIYYETMLQDIEKTYTNICEFLGTKPLCKGTDFIKIAPDNIQTVFLNHDELSQIPEMKEFL